MEPPRDELLARAALAGDEHRGLALRDCVHAVHDAHHPRRPAYKPRARVWNGGECGAGAGQLTFELSRFGNALNPHLDLVEIERLGEVVMRALLQRGDGVSDLAVAGHQDHVGVWRLGTDPPE